MTDQMSFDDKNSRSLSTFLLSMYLMCIHRANEEVLVIVHVQSRSSEVNPGLLK